MTNYYYYLDYKNEILIAQANSLQKLAVQLDISYKTTCIIYNNIKSVYNNIFKITRIYI